MVTCLIAYQLYGLPHTPTPATHVCTHTHTHSLVMLLDCQSQVRLSKAVSLRRAMAARVPTSVSWLPNWELVVLWWQRCVELCVGRWECVCTHMYMHACQQMHFLQSIETCLCAFTLCFLFVHSHTRYLLALDQCYRSIPLLPQLGDDEFGQGTMENFRASSVNVSVCLVCCV